MERSVYRFSLDIRDSIGACQPEMKQGDTHRRLCINLTDGGVPYPIGDGCRVVFTAKKPDGTVIYNTCAVENNTVIYDITPQTTSSAGILGCELQLYDGLADPLELITSAAFSIRVHPRVYNENDIPASEAESTGISAMLHQAEQAIEALSEARESGEFDGMSATHQWNGTVLTVTSASGTSSADLKGEKGEKGEPGTVNLDDATVGDAAWSSKHILEKLCPTMEDSGRLVQCRPVEGYPLEVISRIDPSLALHTGITLTQCGKNLLHFTVGEADTYVQKGNGALAFSSEKFSTNYIPCTHLQGQTVTWNHSGSQVQGNNTTNIGVAFYTEVDTAEDISNGRATYISGTNATTFVVPQNANYMRLTIFDKYQNETMLELGSAITEFEPYWEKTCTVELDDECGGGTLDWSRGLLTVTHKKVDMASLDWQYHEDNCYFYAELPDMAEGTALCSYLTQAPGRFDDITTGGYGYGEPDCVFDISGSTIAVIYANADNVGDLLSDLRPAAAVLVYSLAEPVTQELVATPIPAAAGINTFYSNTGDSQVVGRADPVAILEALTNAVLSLGGNI